MASASDQLAKETSLSVFADAFAQGSRAEAVSIRERHLGQQVNLRGDVADGTFAAACTSVLSCDLPEACSTAVSGDGVKVLWLGPDEWLAVTEEAAAPTLSSRLRKALAGQHAAVVDLEQNRLVIELAGPKARAVLEKACLLDLHPRAFVPGQVAGTVMFKTQVFLEQLDDTPTYWLYVRPSFSRHLAEMLLDAMAEFVA